MKIKKEMKKREIGNKIAIISILLISIALLLSLVSLIQAQNSPDLQAEKSSIFMRGKI